MLLLQDVLTRTEKEMDALSQDVLGSLIFELLEKNSWKKYNFIANINIMMKKIIYRI